MCAARCAIAARSSARIHGAMRSVRATSASVNAANGRATPSASDCSTVNIASSRVRISRKTSGENAPARIQVCSEENAMPSRSCGSVEARQSISENANASRAEASSTTNSRRLSAASDAASCPAGGHDAFASEDAPKDAPITAHTVATRKIATRKSAMRATSPRRWAADHTSERAAIKASLRRRR